MPKHDPTPEQEFEETIMRAQQNMHLQDIGSFRFVTVDPSKVTEEDGYLNAYDIEREKANRGDDPNFFKKVSSGFAKLVNREE
jgi:hypothetical protein